MFFVHDGKVKLYESCQINTLFSIIEYFLMDKLLDIMHANFPSWKIINENKIKKIMTS